MSLWAVFGIVVAGLVGVASLVGYVELEKRQEYSRGKVDGAAETTAAMTKAIAAMKKTALDNAAAWHGKTAPEKISELTKRCIAACEGKKQCIEACSQ